MFSHRPFHWAGPFHCQIEFRQPQEAQGTLLERSQWPCESSKSLYRTGSSELLPCLSLFASKSHGLLLTQQHRPTSDIFPKRDRQPAFSRFNLPCSLISLHHRRQGQFAGNWTVSRVHYEARRRWCQSPQEEENQSSPSSSVCSPTAAWWLTSSYRGPQRRYPYNLRGILE